MSYTKQFKKMLWRHFLKAVGSYLTIFAFVFGMAGAAALVAVLFVSMLEALFGLPHTVAIALAVVICACVLFAGACLFAIWEECKYSAMFDAKNAGIQIEENKDD